MTNDSPWLSIATHWTKSTNIRLIFLNHLWVSHLFVVKKHGGFFIKKADVKYGVILSWKTGRCLPVGPFTKRPYIRHTLKFPEMNMNNKLRLVQCWTPPNNHPIRVVKHSRYLAKITIYFMILAGYPAGLHVFVWFFKKRWQKQLPTPMIRH